MDETAANIDAEPKPWLASRVANTIRFSLMNAFILLGTAAVAYGGLFTWAGAVFSVFLISYVDELVGDAGSRENMPPVWYMQAMLWLTLPLLVLMSLFCFNLVHPIGVIDAVSGALGLDGASARERTDGANLIGAFVSLGGFCGMAGVNVAHELVHRTNSRVDYLLGRWLLAFSWDTGFAIEHVHGHHRTVGTEDDPATARRGEYILAFIVRSTMGQIASAYHHEQGRLKRKGIPDRPWTNRFWRGQFMTLAVVGMFVAFLGPVGVLYALLVAFIAKFYLEAVNYIEHYGLVRIAGRPVEARHSWESRRRVSGGMLYNLQLHSHHHRVASRPFWELKPSEEAPVLPYGYIATIMVALLPVIWNRVIDHRLADWDARLASDDERARLAEKGLLLGLERLPADAPAGA